MLVRHAYYTLDSLLMCRNTLAATEHGAPFTNKLSRLITRSRNPNAVWMRAGFSLRTSLRHELRGRYETSFARRMYAKVPTPRSDLS